MPDELTTWDVIKQVWKDRESVFQFLKEVRDYFRDTEKPTERGILIFGPGGVGKTTLSRILAGEFDFYADSMFGYVESTSNKVVTALHGSDPPVEVVSRGGQPHRRPGAWDELHRELANGEYRGVILLSAFGYHMLPEGSRYQDHTLYAGNKEKFLNRYVADRRADELEVLRQLVPHLQVCPGKVWLLTAVTKQDLWWEERATVERHYREGEYGSVVAGLAATRGGQTFRHETAFASLVINNFDDDFGGRLAKNAAGYDHREHARSLLRLMRLLFDLKAWEVGS